MEDLVCTIQTSVQKSVTLYGLLYGSLLYSPYGSLYQQISVPKPITPYGLLYGSLVWYRLIVLLGLWKSVPTDFRMEVHYAVWTSVRKA